jgi:hypothetical protein
MINVNDMLVNDFEIPSTLLLKENENGENSHSGWLDPGPRENKAGG